MSREKNFASYRLEELPRRRHLLNAIHFLANVLISNCDQLTRAGLGREVATAIRLMTDTSDKSFPVVGIGASAGGLEAVSEMIAELPATTGMAFLLAQHLDPVHESFLTELLAKKAAFTVETAADGAILRPDRLYVIPPNAIMTVADGVLRLRSRDGEEHPRKPVNILFRSLAEQLGHRAIAVVLSGTDSDGRRAWRQSKVPAVSRWPRNRVGEVRWNAEERYRDRFRRLCQDPERSRQGNSPDCAASVLNSGSPDGLTQEEDRLRRIFRLLQSRNGTDFSRYKRTTVQRRLARRMALRQIDGLAEYADLLIKEPDEVQALARDFLIRVTGFFRDPETFAALSETVFPALFDRRSSQGPDSNLGSRLLVRGRSLLLRDCSAGVPGRPRGFDAGSDFRYRSERCGDR